MAFLISAFDIPVSAAFRASAGKASIGLKEPFSIRAPLQSSAFHFAPTVFIMPSPPPDWNNAQANFYSARWARQGPHGLSNGTPIGPKSVTLRVTTVRP